MNMILKLMLILSLCPLAVMAKSQRTAKDYWVTVDLDSISAIKGFMDKDELNIYDKNGKSAVIKINESN